MRLLDSGVLSEVEFQFEKSRILKMLGGSQFYARKASRKDGVTTLDNSTSIRVFNRPIKESRSCDQCRGV